jgi:ADP-heptose:LPS heptosyltransferase
VWIRAPDHLGDGVMALPAVEALAFFSHARIAAPAWGPALYGHTAAQVVGREVAPGHGEIAVLFKPAWSAAWRARRARRRIGIASDARWPLLTDAVASAGRHRCDDDIALARAAGAEPVGLPTLPPSARAPDLPPETVLLLPGTHTPTARWPGFRALADSLGARAVFGAGPDDEAEVRAIAGPHAVRVLEIAELGAAAAGAAAVVGNDSGPAHVAVAARRGAGEDPARVVVVYGSTDPARTGPPGSTAVQGPRPPCWPCYRKRCPFGMPCLGAPVESVVAAVGPRRYLRKLVAGGRGTLDREVE